MNANTILNLVRSGATDRARAELKQLSLCDRLPILHDLFPYVQETPATLAFFRQNFATEMGALIKTNYDYTAAEVLYRDAKRDRNLRNN